MRKLFAVVGASGASLLGAHALAAGALAIDENQGDQWGWAVDQETQAAADRRALRECGAGCRIVYRFSNQCAAFATDQAQGSTAYGYGYAPTRRAAQTNAFRHCRERGGSGRCVVRAWGCDTAKATSSGTTASNADASGGAEIPEMVVIPAGSFRMGCVSGKGCDDDELPVREVRIVRAFAIGRYEVTFAQWDACVADGGCGGYHPPDRRWGRENRPVVNVNWHDAQAYATWLSGKTGQAYRLPSEAEWEYAARAGASTAYSWGDDVGRNRANCDLCGSRWDYRQTAPVGSFPPNAFGLHDMHGNVGEWVADPYCSYTGVPDAGIPAAPNDGSARDHCGITDGRVLRSGSWDDDPRFLRAANRSRGTTGIRNVSIGFRVARTLAP